MLTLIVFCQFFDKPDVDFWASKRREATPPSTVASAWAEPGHVPPAPVARLLDDPSRENALAYIQWQEDRLARLRAAIEAIQAVRPKPRDEEVLYFTQPDCPFCAAQDRELAGAELGGRAVRRVRPGEAPELWKRHGVTGTPALVIDGDVLRGLQSRAQIERRTK
jgi:glutaredoxin